MDIEIKLLGKKRVAAHFDGYEVVSDQPIEDGGMGAAPAPFDLFLASLATCAGFFVQSFCEARGISTDGLIMSQHSEWDEKTHLVSKVEIKIHLPASFPEKYRASIVAAANQCTVKKHLQQPPQLLISLV